MVILKHWHKLPLVENQIAPANSVAEERCAVLFRLFLQLLPGPGYSRCKFPACELSILSSAVATKQTYTHV
jgi:hypothetical protein